jgi:hypothetical protein
MDRADKDRVRAAMLAELGIRVSGLAGLDCSIFLILCHRWLEEGGLSVWQDNGNPLPRLCPRARKLSLALPLGAGSKQGVTSRRGPAWPHLAAFLRGVTGHVVR